MSNSLDARNTPEALVGDMPVFAALSAIKEEAENPLHDTDPEKQHERMVTLFEDAVAPVLYTMVGDQSLPEPTRKALRNKMLAKEAAVPLPPVPPVQLLQRLQPRVKAMPLAAPPVVPAVATVEVIRGVQKANSEF